MDQVPTATCGAGLYSASFFYVSFWAGSEIFCLFLACQGATLDADRYWYQAHADECISGSKIPCSMFFEEYMLRWRCHRSLFLRREDSGF